MKHDYEKMIEALQLAKPIIESGKEYFVCVALEKVCHKRPRLEPAVETLKGWIHKSIEGSFTVRGWLHGRGIFKTLPDSVNSNYSDEMRFYRLRWIDQMISLLKGGK